MAPVRGPASVGAHQLPLTARWREATVKAAAGGFPGSVSQEGRMEEPVFETERKSIR